MYELGKGLILLGGVIAAAGVLLAFFPRIPFLGKLPGDILIKRENFTFFFPLASSIVVSILLSLILALIGRFR